MKCSFCREELPEASSCGSLPIYSKIDNKKYSAIKFGKEKEYDIDLKKCPSCGVKVGGNHHYFCEYEDCPICGDKFYSCTCTIA